MGRLGKLKREAVNEANKRVLGEQSPDEVYKNKKKDTPFQRSHEQWNTNTGDLQGDFINLWGRSPKRGYDKEWEDFKKERGKTTQSSTPQTAKEIKVKWTHAVPYNPRLITDWDSVHAFEKSNNQDDFIDRIGNKLKSGNYRIKDIVVGSEITGGQVITTAEAILVTDDNNPHRRITTRGSIGIKKKVWDKQTNKYKWVDAYDAASKADATKRHDKQLAAGIGIKKKLENAYGGTAERIGGEQVGHYYDIVLPDGKRKWYKQSFYAVTDH